MSKTSRPNKGGRPRVDTEAVTVRMHKLFLERLDDWRAEQRPIPSRPEGIRRFAEIGLESQPLLREFLHLVDEIISEEGDRYAGQLDKLRTHILLFLD